MSDQLVIAGRAFASRLIVGTGKYRSFQEMARAHEASGADMVTVAVRRVNLTDKTKESLLDFIPRDKMFILPNTAACYTAEEAIRTARLGRECGLSNWVKLEVIGDQQTLYPDTEQLIAATRVLVKEGFVVLPYTNDDLIAARKLIDAGASAVMPLAAPIGFGTGHSESGGAANFARTDYRSSDDRGCGRWNRIRCSGGDGTWRRRNPDEYGDCGSCRFGADGGSNARCDDRGPQGISRRAHAEKTLRFCFFSSRWRGALSHGCFALDWSIACTAKSHRHAYIEAEERFSMQRSSELRLGSAS